MVGLGWLGTSWDPGSGCQFGLNHRRPWVKAEKREGKRTKVEERTSEVITIKIGSHDVPIPSGDGVGKSPSKKSEAGTSSSQSASLTRPSGRSDRSHVAGLTGPSGRSDRRPDDGLTDASGRSGRSDRWPTAGLTGLRCRFDERAAKGDVGASSSSSKVNRGHYLPPRTEPNPRWMPKDLTATQKRRLQCLRAQELREKKAEEQRDKRFNELRPPPVWRPKSIEKAKPIDVEEKEEQSVDKDKSSPKEDMDINMVCMLPMEFCAMDEAEVAQFSLGPKDAVFEKPDESNRHMKPLYLKGHVDGKPVSRMLVDGGAAVNLMPYSLFKKLGHEDDELKKTNMILNGFNGEPMEARGIFSAELTVGNKTLPTAFFIVDVQEASLEWLQKRVQEYRSTKNDIGETVEDFDEVEKLGQGFTSADPLEEVDIGDGIKPRPTFVNKNMRADYKVKIIELLKEYVDCFAWEYHEMPGLSRELVEHRLPIKPGFRPYKQPPRRFNPLLYDRVKEEIDRLLKAGFIRPCRYAEWVSSIVPVEKKGSGKIRVCLDFRDLNKATPKDEYPMPIADMMINDALGHKVISFLDGNAGYNQIFMTEEDMYKTAFRCPGFVGLFEWVVMTFGLKSAGATYQRAMNLIFHDLLGIILEIYIDDIVVKSDGMEGHIADLILAFERMRRYGLKMNLLKCAFGVSAGKFLGFMVHERGVEIDPKKIEKIRDFKAPTCKKEVQKLLGKVNYLRRFISNLAGKIDAFVPILRLKKEADFTWGAKQQEAFEELKRYLSTPPVVRAPKAEKPFRLYIASEDKVIGAVLTQEEDGKEYIITYLSRRLLDAESRHIARHDNSRANDLAQQASGYNVKKGLFLILEEPVLDFKSLCEISKIGDQGGLTGVARPDTEEDWRIPLIQYLKDPTLKVDRKIRRQAFKYTLLDEDLYRRNVDGVLLKCLDEDQSKVAIGEGHRFVLVATDYFTKWAEAVPSRNMTHTEANGQAESSNKTLLKLVKKKIEEHPKRWHEVLSEALWAHRISKHGATKVTPFELVYGQEAILPVEVNLGSLRYIKQDDLSSEDYKTLMGDNLDEVVDKRLKALEEIEKEKKRVAKAYNKRVKAKLFQVGDLVWKTILPLGTRSKEFGK
uniref:Retrotransposon protein, putative, unclassified n=1 Tax=Oryza sativa subsp. japonica TaxID=39947 RepID=Q2QU35_ORYSJ|nr:retrotransposon protein, putative, unclassified [Oryza sativa Japonica Group]